jgi:hypothetical protein
MLFLRVCKVANMEGNFALFVLSAAASRILSEITFHLHKLILLDLSMILTYKMTIFC